MKILNSIAYLMLSTAIIMSNNSYTSDSASTNSTNKFQGNSNKGNNNNNTHNNKYNAEDYFQGTESELQELIKNLTIEEKQSNNNNNQVNTKDKIVHFKNESGNNDNLCSLASLNQCLSALNPGNNKLLNDFITEYNKLGNEIYVPSCIFDNLLQNVNIECKKKLLCDPDSDITDRWNILLNISENLNSDISNIIHFTAFYPSSNIDTLNEDLLKKLNNIIIDNYSTGDDLDKLLNYICNDEQIEVNGNTYDLVSVAFLRVNNDNGQPVENNSTHYISAKKQSNGKWVLIDSKFPGKTELFDNFKQLVEKYVNKCCDYQLDDAKAARRFMPRFLCFTKSDNEFSIFNPDNYPSDNQENYN